MPPSPPRIPVPPGPDDARLVARDPHLPGLGVLLDDGAFAALLRTLRPDAAIEDVRSCYARYKPGVSCLVQYVARIGGTNVDLYARTHTADGRQKVEKAAARPAADGPLGPGILVAAEPLVAIYVAPNDHELPALRAVADPAARRRLLSGVLPGHPALWDATPTPLRYKAERRFVGRVTEDGADAAVVKLYDRSSFHAALVNARCFRSSGSLRMVGRLGHSRRRRTIAFEWVDGPRLDHALAPADDTARAALARRTGEVLARLHEQTRTPGADAPPPALAVRSAADAVATLSTALGPRAHRLADRIGAAIEALPAESAPIHGDFAADQVIVDGDRLAVLDCDRATIGDPAADLGTFIGRQAATSTRWPPLAAALVDGYRRAALRAPAELAWRWHAARALLDVAVEPFRRREPAWEASIARRLDRAEEIIGDDRGDG